MFLGENLLEWLLLAFGSAMCVGNLAALVNPPKNRDIKSLKRAPFWRSFIYIIVGLVVAVWSLAGLIG
ncbi:MAG: hypothetical protein CL517_00685 [Actinobacteria bacterium]|nr:hypothetical protein [Actinomycetota bacterium]MEC7809683.1 hypothetical protein [Actinomycetota bacterium]